MQFKKFSRAPLGVNYLLSPGAVRNLDAAKQALLVHTIGELVLFYQWRTEKGLVKGALNLPD